MSDKKVQSTAQNNDLVYLESHTKKIKDTVSKIKDDFVYIGFLLWEVKQYKYYQLKGYSSIVDYAEKELGFKKRSTYNFIAVCERFSRKNEKGAPTMSIDSKFKDYNFTQLCEVLPIDDSKLIEVNPNMSAKQIREVKKVQSTAQKDEVIKRKGKDEIVDSEFGSQIDVTDVIPVDVKDNKNDDFLKSVDEMEKLEAANKILKNRKESLEVKNDNLKKINKEKDESINGLIQEIRILKEQIENIKLANERERNRDNEKIKKLENDNANLCNMIADLRQQIDIESQKNKTLKVLNDELNKSLSDKLKAVPSVKKKTDKSKEESKAKAKSPSSLNNITK